ncbi:MAG: phasin family protein [Candidatus Contendobacter sp.]|nr:phasin family protein [Candidatus Contendobacter sp.]MDG4557250.1 phasin family protein [Candidatus Contendobacter sp.]
MVKKVKGNADSQLSQSVRESAHLIWLAGLGAFTKVSAEGGKLFEALVKEGEKIEERTREVTAGAMAAAREQTGEARGRVVETWDKVEQIFEDRLNRVLGQLGIPSREDLRELTQRIDALQAQLDELGRGQDSPRP